MLTSSPSMALAFLLTGAPSSGASPSSNLRLLWLPLAAASVAGSDAWIFRASSSEWVAAFSVPLIVLWDSPFHLSPPTKSRGAQGDQQLPQSQLDLGVPKQQCQTVQETRRW